MYKKFTVVVVPIAVCFAFLVPFATTHVIGAILRDPPLSSDLSKLDWDGVGAIMNFVSAAAAFAAAYAALHIAGQDRRWRESERESAAAAMAGDLVYSLSNCAASVIEIVDAWTELEFCTRHESDRTAIEAMSKIQFDTIDRAMEKAYLFDRQTAQALGTLAGLLRTMKAAANAHKDESGSEITGGSTVHRLMMLAQDTSGRFIALHERMWQVAGMRGRSYMAEQFEDARRRLEDKLAEAASRAPQPRPAG